MADEANRTRCHAITEGGERCQRPAGENGFCHQHDESDETVEEYDGETEGGDGGADRTDEAQGRAAMSDGGSSAEVESESESEDSQDGDDESEAESESEEDGGTDGSGRDDGGLSGVRDVRETVQSLAPEVIGRELDAVIEVDSRDDGWLAVVEIVERPAVPDSQDILGRYEIDFADGAVTGYRRVDRYRRSDTDRDEFR